MSEKKFKLDSFRDALRKRREQAALQRARTSLLGYIEYIAPTYKPSRVHRYLIEKFERGIVRCNSPRLMCSKPPQHGKTQLAIFLIEYLLGCDPTRNVVYITYSDDGRATLAVRCFIVSRTIRVSGKCFSLPKWIRMQRLLRELLCAWRRVLLHWPKLCAHRALCGLHHCR